MTYGYGKNSPRAKAKASKEFFQAANAITFEMHAKPFTPAPPAPPKTADEIAVRDAAVLKGLARAVLKTGGITLEKGREVTLTGKASNGLAITAAATLLKLDTTGQEPIKLNYQMQGEFSKAAQLAIADTIKALHATVEIVAPKAVAAIKGPTAPSA